jgi:hypothetical protein
MMGRIYSIRIAFYASVLVLAGLVVVLLVGVLFHTFAG